MAETQPVNPQDSEPEKLEGKEAFLQAIEDLKASDKDADLLKSQDWQKIFFRALTLIAKMTFGQASKKELHTFITEFAEYTHKRSGKLAPPPIASPSDEKLS